MTPGRLYYRSPQASNASSQIFALRAVDTDGTDAAAIGRRGWTRCQLQLFAGRIMLESCRVTIPGTLLSDKDCSKQALAADRELHGALQVMSVGIGGETRLRNLHVPPPDTVFTAYVLTLVILIDEVDIRYLDYFMTCSS